MQRTMPASLKVSETGFQLISDFEQRADTVYLRSDIKAAEELVRTFVRVELYPYEFDAMVDLVLDVGRGRLRGDRGEADAGEYGICIRPDGTPSILLQQLNAGDYASIPRMFTGWKRRGPAEFEDYRRRLAGMLRFMDLPWKRALNACSSPMFTIDEAIALALEEKEDLDGLAPPVEKLTSTTSPTLTSGTYNKIVEVRAAPPPPPPKPPAAPAAEKIIAGVDGVKPVSVNSVPREKVPYGIDADAPLKPMEETGRYSAAKIQDAGRLMLTLASKGMFGSTAASPAAVIIGDQFVLATVLGYFASGVIGVAGAATKSYGNWKRLRAEDEAGQGMF